MRIRPKFLGAAALTGLLLFLAASVFFSHSPGANQTESFETRQAREQAERAQIFRDDRQADFLAGWFQITLAATTLLVLGAGTVATVQFVVIQPNHRRKLEQARALEEFSRLYPDPFGNYPAKTTPYGGLLQPAAGNVIQPVSQSLHYAPHLQLKEPASTATLAALPENLTAPEAELPSGPVDLLSLLHNWKPSADNILLALGPGGKPITVAARELCHVALAGATGGGKSNLVRLLLSQLLACNAHVCLADPHYTRYDLESGEDWRTIEEKLYLPPAIRPDQIGQLLSWLAQEELALRLERRRNQQPVGGPLFLAIDELPAIVADVKNVQEHMGRILREGRKVNLLLLTSAQDWLVKTVGGTGAVRDNFRTSYYVGGDPTSARVLLDLQGRVDDGQLGRGLALLRSRPTPKAALVKIPYASNEALNRLLLPSQDFYLGTKEPGTNVPEQIVKTNQTEPFESGGAYANMISIKRQPSVSTSTSTQTALLEPNQPDPALGPTPMPASAASASEQPEQLTELERAFYAWNQLGANSVRKLASALGVSRYRAEGLAAQLKLFEPEPSGSEAE